MLVVTSDQCRENWRSFVGLKCFGSFNKVYRILSTLREEEYATGVSGKAFVFGG